MPLTPFYANAVGWLDRADEDFGPVVGCGAGGHGVLLA